MQRRTFLGLAATAAATAAARLPLAGETVTQRAFQLATGFPAPDPFCVRRPEGWYLVGTQHARGVEDRRFCLFFSPDLVAWKNLGPVLERPEYEGSHKANYWAPEFAERGGKFYFYYTSDSDGDPERRYVRVGVSDNISGPYVDTGDKLVNAPSIDGHPHFTESGQGRLFYTGNEGNPHVGQLLVDRFVSPLKLENKPRLVFPDETVEWEEGPFVIREAGAYYLFSSRGNWRDGSYHVQVAKAASLDGPWTRLTREGELYSVVKTVEGQWGPGHNSVFRGPDDKWWICYHAWDKEKTGRYPWVAPIEWDSQGFPVVRQ